MRKRRTHSIKTELAILESQSMLATLGGRRFEIDPRSPLADEVLLKHHPDPIGDFSDGMFDDEEADW